MKRDELLRRIATRARRQGVDWTLDRQGSNHEIWRCGTTRVTIPRHLEIGNGVTHTILRELQ
jgi:hypothetical protein